jgi:hypothetical protein
MSGGTSALYFAEVERKRRTPGDFTWRVTTLHLSRACRITGSCGFSVRSSRHRSRVTVEAFDGDAGAHRGCARAAASYRGSGQGALAKVKVAKGRYALVVSGFNYIGRRSSILLSDVSRAELAVGRRKRWIFVGGTTPPYRLPREADDTQGRILARSVRAIGVYGSRFRG